MGEIPTDNLAFARIQLRTTVLLTVSFFVCVLAVCEDVLGELTALLQVLNHRRTMALIGSVDPALCETVAKLATQRGKAFITWSCPQVTFCVRVDSTLARLRAGGVEVRMPAEVGAFLQNVQTITRSQSASYSKGDSCLGLKGRDVDNSLLCSTEIRNEWSITSACQGVDGENCATF